MIIDDLVDAALVNVVTKDGTKAHGMCLNISDQERRLRFELNIVI